MSSPEYLICLECETPCYVFEWEDGSNAVLAKLGRNGVIVAKDFADQKNLEIGDTARLLTPSARTADLVVRGIYKPPPFFPLLGPLGMVPLPSKWLIEFGEPIRTDSYDEGAADDPMLVFNVTDQVRETIQQTLYTLLMQRRSVFF